MKYVAVDYETEFSKEYSVADMGAWHYCQDPRFDAYMVAVASSDGFRWVGHPRDCDWSKVFGEDVTLLAHNVGFDQVVTERLHELGTIPKPVYADWQDTADLAAFLGAPRNLAGASEMLLGKTMSKEMRSFMSGKRFEDLPQEKQQAMLAYALQDADNCLELWMKHSDKWPEHERWLSKWTRNIPRRGIPVNLERINAGVSHLQKLREEALASIPWVKDGNPPLSRKFLDAHCHSLGIEVPKSLAQDSEEAVEWEEKYSGQYPFVATIRTFRKVNTFCTKLETIQRKTRDGRFMAELLYFGASLTARWSGAGRVNIQNLPRDEMFGVDLRKCFEAPPGYVFVTYDLAQIEPRCLAVMSGNSRLLTAVRNGFGIYEAYARANLGWEGGPLKKEDPQMYRLAKAACVSGDTLVLTNNGYKPISTISLVDMVWDGYDWVTHEGVVITKHGRADCNVGGDRFTEDHKLFVSDSETRPAGEIPKRSNPAKLERNSHQLGGWEENRELATALLRICAECWEEGIRGLALFMHSLWDRASSKRKQSNQRVDLQMQPVWKERSQSAPQQKHLGEGY